MSSGPRKQPQHPATIRRGEGVTADGEFFMPTRVLFGRGVTGQAGTHAASLGAGKVMLVTDPGVEAAGVVDPVRTQPATSSCSSWPPAAGRFGCC
jgi:hypothetical protein